ncbi:MAG: hypothetical protein WB607_26020 [Candidatus Acidiferrum sp.]
MRIESSIQGPVLDKASHDPDTRLRFVFSSPYVVSIQSAVDCLLAASQEGSELVAVHLGMLLGGSKNHFSRDR